MSTRRMRAAEFQAQIYQQMSFFKMRHCGAQSLDKKIDDMQPPYPAPQSNQDNVKRITAKTVDREPWTKRRIQHGTVNDASMTEGKK